MERRARNGAIASPTPILGRGDAVLTGRWGSGWSIGVQPACNGELHGGLVPRVIKGLRLGAEGSDEHLVLSCGA